MIFRGDFLILMIIIVQVRKDVGGVTMMPTIVVVFFGEPKTLRVKFEGVNEVVEGMNRFVSKYFTCYDHEVFRV